MHSLLNIDEFGEVRNDIPGRQGFRRIPGGPKDFYRTRHFTLVDLAVAGNAGQDFLRPGQAITGAFETATTKQMKRVSFDTDIFSKAMR
jgi:hypothetical protein